MSYRCTQCGQLLPSVPASTASSHQSGAQHGQRSVSAFVPAMGPRPSPLTPKLLPLLAMAGVLILVGGLVSFAIWRAGHPTVVVVNRDTNEVVLDQAMPRQQAEKLAETAKIREIQDVPLQLPKVTVTPPKSEFKTVKEIDITAKVLAGAAAGDLSYVNGTFTNHAGKGLKSVTLTVYVDGKTGPQATYELIPSDCTLPYSISLPMAPESAKKADIRVGAAFALADDRLVIWLAEADLFSRRVSGESVSWSGQVRNPSNWPLRNVRAICDFFQDDGSQGGSVQGGLADAGTLASQGKGRLVMTTNQVSAQAAVTFVIRAAGEKY